MTKKLDYLLKEVVFKETTEGTREITSNASIKTYKASISDFTDWAKETHGLNRINELGDIKAPITLIESYVKHLEQEGRTPATIHTRIAPICKGFGIRMNEVEHPARTAKDIVRGRFTDNNVQGRREIESEKYKDFAEFASAVGIRRAEYTKLKVSDIEKKDGYLCVHVARGKGGKEHWQRILPQHQDTVLTAIKGLNADEKIFKTEITNNHINLHKMRANIAKEAYQYYANKLLHDKDGSITNNYIKELDKCFKDAHNGVRSKAFSKELQGCIDDNSQLRAYYLKGDNRTKAKMLGLPTEYNRLAVMMVSVFHLSHWRADVTIISYLNQT